MGIVEISADDAWWRDPDVEVVVLDMPTSPCVLYFAHRKVGDDHEHVMIMYSKVHGPTDAPLPEIAVVRMRKEDIDFICGEHNAMPIKQVEPEELVSDMEQRREPPPKPK
jgi:glycerol-3-phosphate dehydrogenase